MKLEVHWSQPRQRYAAEFAADVPDTVERSFTFDEPSREWHGELTSNGGIKASLQFISNFLDDLNGAVIFLKAKDGGPARRLDIVCFGDTCRITESRPDDPLVKDVVTETDFPRPRKPAPEPELVIRRARPED